VKLRLGSRKGKNLLLELETFTERHDFLIRRGRGVFATATKISFFSESQKDFRIQISGKSQRNQFFVKHFRLLFLFLFNCQNFIDLHLPSFLGFFKIDFFIKFLTSKKKSVSFKKKLFDSLFSFFFG